VSLLDRTLREQALAVASGEADPEALLEESLARIQARDPKLNSVIATFENESRAMLARAPQGPLHGVPVAIKDEWPLPWRAETLGAAEYVGRPTQAAESGPYRALRDAGAVIIAVTNMHEYGSGTTGAISAYGPARNPWNTERCTGGSSSGSAAAVAGRLVAGAVGADGVGSIRTPSSWCGLTGLKPTFGRSAMAGHHVRETTTLVSGPICRDAVDCRLLGSALFGEQLAASDVAGLRVGTVPGDLSVDVAGDVASACAQALDQLADATGGTVTEVELPGREHVLMSSILLLQSEDFADVVPADVMQLGEEVSLVARALSRYRFLIPANAVERARRVRQLVRRSLARAFEQVDVIAWPTLAATAPPLASPVLELPSGTYPADLANARQIGIANLTGVPAITMPVGHGDGGLPIGLQLLAPWGRDELLIDAAEALERQTERRWVDAEPALARTS
jgi:Asp-tRNA(Asn)/Glu-tRNA(Gln) amidotransferase A subunit family amidase